MANGEFSDGLASCAGPDSNFTIWHARGYIFGYCELVKVMETPPTEEEKQALIDWETKQLAIMDWVTDDTDWIFGTVHSAIERIMTEIGGLNIED